MKKNYRIVLFIAIMAGVVNLVAQSESASPRYSFHIAKEVKPPYFEIVEGPDFVDEDGNRAIDAQEKCKIVMKIKNTGRGDGIGLTAKIDATGAINGITFTEKKIPNIPVGSTATIEYPINSDMKTVDGSVVFSVYVDEPFGFGTEKYYRTITTRKFQEPLVVVKDVKVSGDHGGKLEKRKPFVLEVLVQNTGQGLAENVQVELDYPREWVSNLDGQDMYAFPELPAGEYKQIDFNLAVNGRYEGTSLPLAVKIREKMGKYAQNKDNIVLTLNQPLANRSEILAQIATTEIKDVMLTSDVDRDIPETDNQYPNRFALIIGNEDYHNNQPGLESEQDVHFAIEDAKAFKQYCIKTLGIKEEHIVYQEDATGSQMRQRVAKIRELASLDPNAEIVFYYAGHGFPDENTKIPYLIPVDVSAKRLSEAISLYDLCGQLSNSGAQRVTVFLDACFSGGGRDEGLMVSRGISVTPKKDVLTGNIVVFSATTADQTALPYAAKHHGMFTYFLLKKLQESQGECSYSELFEYLKNNVSKYSILENDKKQTPDLQSSPWVQNSWGGWKFIDN